MFFSVVLSYLPYALVTSFTPGPNNILHSTPWARRHGSRAATLAGHCRRLFFRDGGLRAGLLPAGAAAPRADPGAPLRRGPLSLLAGPPSAPEHPCKGCQSPVYLLERFFLQFVNGKIILYAITIYTGYVLPAGSGALFPIQPFVLTLFGTAGFLTWAVAGGLLQSFCAGTPGRSTGPWPPCWPSAPWIFFFESVAPHPIPHGFRADRATTARQATRPPETSPIQQTARAREGTGSLSYRTWISHRIRP